MASNSQPPTITSTTPLSNADAKWLSLSQIAYTDATGTARTWEMASRKTTSAAGIDAVAIGAIILQPSRPASTVLVIQYRPPLDAYTVEWPAGLIDADESPADAALRELREETGYGGGRDDGIKVLSVSPAVAADAGLSSANMALVMVEVRLQEGEEPAAQRLDDGELVERVVVPLAELWARLGEYARMERFVVAAKLWHFAQGMEFQRTQKYF